MLATLSIFFNRIASWKTLLLAIALYVVFPAYILKNLEIRMNAAAGKSIGPIDLLMGYDPGRVNEMVAAYGSEGRAIYALGEMTADVIYPIVYTTLFCIILSLLFRNRSYAPFSRINVLPVFVLIVDFLENACIVYLLKSYPESSEQVAVLCSVFTNLKWALFFGVVGLIIYGLLRMAMSRFQKQLA
ncbi:hypothetical protein GCM10028807_08030 [Spirosoma daeguense]